MRKTRTRLLPVLAFGVLVAVAAVAVVLGPAPTAADY